MRGVAVSDGYRLRGSAVCAALCLIAAAAACGGEDAAPASSPPAVTATVAEPAPATTVPATTVTATTAPATTAPATTEPASLPTLPPTTSTLATTTTIAEPDGWVAPDEYEEYVTITDDYEALEVEVPAEWAELDGYVPFSDVIRAEFGVGLKASPDLDGFTTTWRVPGVVVAASDQMAGDSADQLDLATSDLNLAAACTAGQVEDYDDGLYRGFLHEFTECGGTSAAVTVIAAQDDDGVEVVVVVQTVSPADDAALQRIIDTFVVVGSTDGALESATDGYSGYRQVVDDSGALQVTVPDEWTHVRSQPGFRDNDDLFYGVVVSASTDIDEWNDSWGVSGMRFAATERFDGDIDRWFYGDYTQFVEGGWFYRSSCTEEGVYEYADPLYTGLYGNYVECGGGETDLVVVVAAPADDAFVILLAVTLVTDADDEALQRILDTFEVIGDPG